jgi:hypothetical protein
MKWMSLIAALGLVVGLVGCNTNPAKSTSVKGAGGKELELTPPGNTTVMQGKEEKIKVGISRTNFDEPVEIAFEQLPDGVTIKEAEKVIPKDKDSGEFTLVPAEKAPIKENHVVKITAKGPDEMSTTSEFKLTVKEKK